MNKRDQPSLDKARVRATFNKAASRYENFDFLQREVGNRLLQRLDVNDKNNVKTILELGCGIGNHVIKQAKMVGNEGLIIATDYSRKSLRLLRKNLRTKNVKIKIKDNIFFIIKA